MILKTSILILIIFISGCFSYSRPMFQITNEKYTNIRSSTLQMQLDSLIKTEIKGVYNSSYEMELFLEVINNSNNTIKTSIKAESIWYKSCNNKRIGLNHLLLLDALHGGLYDSGSKIFDIGPAESLKFLLRFEEAECLPFSIKEDMFKVKVNLDSIEIENPGKGVTNKLDNIYIYSLKLRK